MSVYLHYMAWVTAAAQACRDGREVFDIKTRERTYWGHA